MRVAAPASAATFVLPAAAVVALEQLRAMGPKLWPSVASSPSLPADSLDGNGESFKWLKGCWWSKSLSYGSLFMLTILLVSIVVLEFHTEVAAPWRSSASLKPPPPESVQLSTHKACEKALRRYKRMGVDTLPRGIIQETSDLYFRALGTNPTKETQKLPTNQSLLAMPVGIKQKETVNKIVQKFPEGQFVVMLFHYDGKVDEWNVFPWSSRAIHVVGANQTKWWFAKRFLHPDIVSSYKYLFIWDEDIGVHNFDAGRYIEIVEREGLEISQPALDAKLSEVHHQITIRRPRDVVHRRIFKTRGSGLCFQNSTKPPCTGWVEMMVPVFSRAAWRCSWYMIQNDLVHAWGLDMKLGHCAQGDPSQKVGIVDEQYVVHFGIPSLGGLSGKIWDERTKSVSAENSLAGSQTNPNASYQERAAVRRRSYVELELFQRRWDNAATKDRCWQDPSEQL